MRKELIEYLSGFLTTNRLQRFSEVLPHRTRHITVVLEDIYQPHNAAAVLRSCDCFGIQDIYVIENQNKFRPSPEVELGALKWLSLHTYQNTHDCIASLKRNGYRIVVTSPHRNDSMIDEIDIASKTALFFGTEMRGVSPIAFDQADAFVKIPMVGFTESLNLSVSAAIALYTLISRLKKSNINWKLTQEEMFEVKLQWIKNSLQRAELLEKEFYAKKTSQI